MTSLVEGMPMPSSPSQQSSPSSTGPHTHDDVPQISSPPQPAPVLSHTIPVPPRKPTTSRRKDPSTARMRSTIACCRCRRSKVKCINGGVDTTCQACDHASRECTYPTPGNSGPGPSGSAPTHIAAALGSTTLGASTGGSAATQTGTATSTSASAVIVAAAAAAATNASVPGSSIAGQIRQRDEVRFDENGTSNKRPRHKRSSVAANHLYNGRDGLRSPSDALDPSVLTAKVWIELFDIWQVHFSAELPFLHLPTIRRPLHQAADATPTMPPASPLLLCAFLALTAPYHPGLNAYHCPNATQARPVNPSITAEYYAEASRTRVAGVSGLELFTPDLQRVQALLMMAIYEWGANRGTKALVLLSIAIRLALLMGLQYEKGFDDLPLYRAVVPDPEISSSNGVATTDGLSSSMDDDFIQREIRRRTFWSCYIMDCYFSTGKFRPPMLDPATFRIQLPCSDPSFLFGHNVRTLLMSEDPSSPGVKVPGSTGRNGTSGDDSTLPGSPRHSRLNNGLSNDDENTEPEWEVGSEEGSISRFTKASRLFGQISNYLCAGGRLRESATIWDHSSTYSEINSQLRRFSESLPRSLNLSSANISAHVTNRTSTPYLAMHTVHLLCTVLMHRDSLPLLPVLRKADKSAADSITRFYNLPDAPADFIEKGSHGLYRSAREIVDVFRASQDWSVLPRTPMTGFAIYQAALVGIYAVNFPWMDPSATLRRTASYPLGTESKVRDQNGLKATHKAIEIIGGYCQTLKMALNWLVTLQRLNMFYMNVRAALRDESNSTEFSLEKADVDGDASELDTILRAAISVGDGSSRIRPVPVPTTRVQSAPTKVEDAPDSTPRRDGWNAINTNQPKPEVVPPPSPPTTAVIKPETTEMVDVPDQRPLEGFELRFTPDDLAAHVAGANWKEWSQNAVDSNGVGGWLYTIYKDHTF